MCRGWFYHVLCIASLEPIASGTVVLFVPILFLLVRYMRAWLQYNKAYSHRKENQVPPVFPHLVPIIGSAIPFAFNCLKLFKEAT